MDDLLVIANKFSNVGFPTLLVLIGFGSYFRIWVWGRELVEAKADLNKQLAEAKEEADEWKRCAFQWGGIAETSVGIAKTSRVP